MKTHLFILALALAILNALASAVDATVGPLIAAPEEVKPPFGLTWDETIQRVEKLLRGAKAEITSRKHENEEEVLYVKGLVQTGLERTLFAFRDGRLKRVSLHYERSGWEPAQFEDFFRSVEERISKRYGECEETVKPKEGLFIPKEKVWKKPATRIVLKILRADGEEGKQEGQLRLEVTYMTN